jgi:hypothetical protein
VAPGDETLNPLSTTQFLLVLAAFFYAFFLSHQCHLKDGRSMSMFKTSPSGLVFVCDDSWMDK